MAHPLDFEEKEPEKTKTKRVVNGVHAILQACLDSKTVKRVIYTSSVTGGAYVVTKTLTEKTALEFGEKYGLDVVSVLPTWITGPFICSHVPDSVLVSLALILGEKKHYHLLKSSSLVHVDDVARAHIHLFEYPEAKGRYLCTGVEISIEDLCEFISARYTEYEMPTADSLKDLLRSWKFSGIPSTKLLETGFEYENGLEEMFDGAIKCCKEKGLL
ncbi:hypothetical protein ACJIZ3_018376 [Penstemon smallii]|uniref:NAD-dependent epimerase/dehydratase domain-containing protein n=1 Tax=Penstemon smallii TaxID=265156 RepID=A0ABD3SY67_9LAMI